MTLALHEGNEFVQVSFPKITFKKTWRWTVLPLEKVYLLIFIALREKCANAEFFLVVFSRVRTEYGEIRSISTYSVQMRENTDQKKLCIWTLFTQCWNYTHRGVFKALWNISDRAFCENSWWLTAVICFHKKLYLNIWQGCEYGADSRKFITKILICISSNWEFCCFIVQFLSYKPQLLVQKPYSEEVKAHLSAYMFPSFNHMAILFSSTHVCRNMFLAK